MNPSLDVISDFLEKQEEDLYIPMIPLHEIEGVFEKHGYKREEEENPLNGWEISFWYTFSHPTKTRYTIGGSLWYGDFKIYKDEEDTTEEEG